MFSIFAMDETYKQQALCNYHTLLVIRIKNSNMNQGGDNIHTSSLWLNRIKVFSGNSKENKMGVAVVSLTN